MSDMLADGSAWLSSVMDAHVSKSVTYTDGTNSVALNATVGRTVFETTDEAMNRVRHESRDFIVYTEDLVLSSVQLLPVRGHHITEVDGDTTRTYMVTSPDQATPHWEYADPYHERLRIHTKLVKTVTT